MKIQIETVPHDQHRYQTIGDYWIDESGVHQVRVSDFGDDRLAQLVMIHELVEYFICLHRGIDEPAIKAFDEAVPDDSPYVDDPGHDPAAPYHREHVFAECLERLLARELDVNWQNYEKRCLALFE